MKFFQKITWFCIIIQSYASIIPMSQVSPTTVQERLRTLNSQNPQVKAEQLTIESYINPEIQFELLSLFDIKNIQLDLQTGCIKDMPTPTQILNIATQRLSKVTIVSQEKEILKNALHSLLEATEIALFVAKIEATFDPNQSALAIKADEQVIAQLMHQKTNITNLLSIAQNKLVSDPAQSTSSYFSWFWTPSYNTDALISDTMPPLFISFDPEEQQTVSIPTNFFPTIIKSNDYKNKTNAQLGANLLFQECFIAQEHHLKDQMRIQQLKFNFQSPFSHENYIYTHFPSFQDICNIAQTIGIQAGIRRSLQDQLNQGHQQAHQLLLHTRQAVQTALYIANKKSSVNVGYIFPVSVISYLDGIVSELLTYDKILAELCKDPQIGATLQDTHDAEKWSTITKVAAGVVVTAVALGTLHFFAPTLLPTVAQTGYTYLGQIGNSLSNGISNWWTKPAAQTSSTAPQQTSAPTPSIPTTANQSKGWFSGWSFSKNTAHATDTLPTIPSQVSNDITTNSSNTENSKQVVGSLITTTLTAGNFLAKRLTQAAGIIALTTTGVQLAAQATEIELDPLHQDIITKANTVSKIGLMVGLTSSGVLANASMLLSNGSWYNIFDLFEKWQAAASLYSTANALIHQNNKQSKNIAQSQQRDTPLTTQPAELLPAEKIAKILSHVSINRIENNQNPIPALNDAIVQLARQTTPEDMCVALTALQQEFIQVPVIAEHCQAQIEVIELYQAQILKHQSPHQQTIKGV